MSPLIDINSAMSSQTMGVEEVETGIPPALSFSHIHLYTKELKPLSEYKSLEQRCNDFASASGFTPTQAGVESLEEMQKIWTSMDVSGYSPVASETSPANSYISQGRDVVAQLICGLGFRVSSVYDGADTTTMLVTSPDNTGVQFVVTAQKAEKEPTDGTLAPGKTTVSTDGITKLSFNDEFVHFDVSQLLRFFKNHQGRPGISCLAFEVTSGDITNIYNNYSSKHPKLLTPQGMVSYKDGSGSITRVLEVFAYYKGEKQVSDADEGTILRFVEKKLSHASAKKSCKLPGLVEVDATFDGTSFPAYCDHWVSNVVSRTGFLDTLEDTLGFTPKVDFNAGVVAAGEAQIESTVTGNTAAPVDTGGDDKIALKDQSQVYLPINNALTPIGHVHGFIEEIGQGVQHVASRVSDLIAFIQRANDCRRMTGEGFTFLNIPQSYYGVMLKAQFLNKVDSDEPLLGDEDAAKVMIFAEENGLCDLTGAVPLDITREEVKEKLSKCSTIAADKVDDVMEVVMRARFVNLHTLLRGHMSEKSYIAIVKNKILVDVQGEDLLFQIFTSNVLQENVGDEAPFFEFIQRVCSECLGPDGCPAKVKPGCGGFGIRNFLTLFLSIEVSKAMMEVKDAKLAGDAAAVTKAMNRVGAFTDQLNEANPILTDISDAMTAEGGFMEDLAKATDEAEKARLQALADEQALKKKEGNEKLMVCSKKYMEIMKALREA
ncbi:hypothetical protein TrRE_jg3029 [Triparma retinervis]|uniref:4-hydroxyphenylpyruvate dioxygenase n=1 Tax=Triparma retinervis TaxID=2557542 RepID=A0A9W7DLJ4_9STRA|nr:hypothetical protein TrRE_jg3029 [Triparma retinervis]